MENARRHVRLIITNGGTRDGKGGSFQSRFVGRSRVCATGNGQVSPWLKASLQFNFKNYLQWTSNRRPFTKQMNSVSGGSFGNLCGRGKELSTDSEHQPISRSRVDKCSATLVAVSVENISVEAPRPQRARYKASEAGF